MTPPNDLFELENVQSFLCSGLFCKLIKLNFTKLCQLLKQAMTAQKTSTGMN